MKIDEQRPPTTASGATTGELLGHLAVSFEHVADFGLTLTEILQGAPVPIWGARIDVEFTGVMSGVTLGGPVTGTDHLDIRPALQVVRHLHLRFLTEFGGRVAAAGEGVVTPTSQVAVTELRLALLCRSLTPQTRWIDGQSIWAVGQVDPVNGVVEGDLYLAAGVAPPA